MESVPSEYEDCGDVDPPVLDDAEFEQVKNSVLDHLVPAEERQDSGNAQDEESEVQEDDDGLIDQERTAAVQSLKQNCEVVEHASKAEREWSQEGTSQVMRGLVAAIQKQTPLPEHYKVRDAVIKRIDSVVRQGLLHFDGMHVEHYGSFTSGLFTPNGDLDIAIEGVLKIHDNKKRKGKPELDRCVGLNVCELDKDTKAMILRALCNKLRDKSISDGKIDRILHARVPIIKFTDWQSGIDCDMAVGSRGARFKSTVLRHLSQIDSRFPELTRLVKLWAQAYHMNDASNGTFNTFALTLMVVFHLQTRSPPVLPPICELFDMSPAEIEGRPLHRGQRADMSLLEESESRALAWQKPGNQESLLDLLSSFFALYTTALGVWTDNRTKRAVRCCTWAGRWAYKRWSTNYIVPIEDPFDSTDNCARSIFAANVGYAKDSFFHGLLALRDLRDTPAADYALKALFTVRNTPFIRHPFRNSNRWQDGWGRPGRSAGDDQRGPREGRSDVGLRNGPSHPDRAQFPTHRLPRAEQRNAAAGRQGYQPGFPMQPPPGFAMQPHPAYNPLTSQWRSGQAVHPQAAVRAHGAFAEEVPGFEQRGHLEAADERIGMWPADRQNFSNVHVPAAPPGFSPVETQAHRYQPQQLQAASTFLVPPPPPPGFKSSDAAGLQQGDHARQDWFGANPGPRPQVGAGDGRGTTEDKRWRPQAAASPDLLMQLYGGRTS